MRVRPSSFVFAALIATGCGKSDSASTTTSTGTPSATGSGTGSGTGTGAGTGTGTGAGTGAGTGTGTGGTTSTAPDFVGAWRVERITATGAPELRYARDFVGFLVADPAGVGPQPLTAATQQVSGGVAASSLGVDQGTWEPGGNGKILMSNGDTQVFDVTTTTSGITLTWDSADPRNQVSTLNVPADTIDLAPLPSPTPEGTWAATSVTEPGGATFATDTCLPMGGGVWAKATVDLTLGPYGEFTIHSDSLSYSDDRCTNLTSSDPYDAGGTWLDDGSNAEIWSYNMDSIGTWDAVSFTIATDTLTLTRLDCRPSPSCLNEGFQTVVLERQP